MSGWGSFYSYPRFPSRMSPTHVRPATTVGNPIVEVSRIRACRISSGVAPASRASSHARSSVFGPLATVQAVGLGGGGHRAGNSAGSRHDNGNPRLESMEIFPSPPHIPLLHNGCGQTVDTSADNRERSMQKNPRPVPHRIFLRSQTACPIIGRLSRLH